MDPRPEAGGYGLFRLDGKDVAGVGPQQDPNMPPYWTVYVTVANVDDTLAKAKAAGGTVVAGPMPRPRIRRATGARITGSRRRSKEAARR